MANQITDAQVAKSLKSILERISVLNMRYGRREHTDRIIKEALTAAENRLIEALDKAEAVK